MFNRPYSHKIPANVTTYYEVDYDPDAQFEECNGEARPLTEYEYANNEYVKDGSPVSYTDYLKYYGNPDRHVYLMISRKDRCPCCDSWVNGGSLGSIDFMDDDKEAHAIGLYALDELPGYLRECATDLEPAEIKKGTPDLLEAARDVIGDLKLFISRQGPGPDRRLATLQAAIAKAEGQV